MFLTKDISSQKGEFGSGIFPFLFDIWDASHNTASNICCQVLFMRCSGSEVAFSISRPSGGRYSWRLLRLAINPVILLLFVLSSRSPWRVFLKTSTASTFSRCFFQSHGLHVDSCPSCVLPVMANVPSSAHFVFVQTLAKDEKKVALFGSSPAYVARNFMS